MAPTFQDLLFDVSDHVATITINRPEHANSFTLNTMKELSDAAIECDMNDEVRAVLLTGSGRMFSAGADLKDVLRGDDFATFVKQATTYFHASVSRLQRMKAPVVTAVNGMAAGGGFSYALMGDIVIAAESAIFTSAYTKSALSPDGSSTWFVPRLIGMRRAQELFLTNRRLSATEALDWGLITRVVPDAELMPTAAEIAREFAAGPTLAYGGVKRLLASSFDTGLETQMEFEAQMLSDCGRSADVAEGISAFVEKRRPVFQGR